MALSKRLLAIYQMVDTGSIVADIGCDHGLLAIALIQGGIAPHVYACDLRKGPLSRAKAAIEEAHLKSHITTLLRNGMDDLPTDVDTIVIAGMGFDTIKMILESHLDELSRYHKFIIQSNKHVEDLRRWISDHHFTIVEEDIVEEDHFYQIVSFTCSVSSEMDEDTILFGKSLYDHPLFTAYWTHRKEKVSLILERMPKHHENYASVENLYQRITTQLEKQETSRKE